MAETATQRDFRFPPGTRFVDVKWDGETWTAHLEVPNGPDKFMHFHGIGTSVENVLRKMKHKYIRGLQHATPPELAAPNAAETPTAPIY